VVVGIVTWDLHLNGCASLKDKRRVLKSLKDRLHRQLNVSVAETAQQDRWQRAELTAASVATDRRQAEEVLGAAERLVGGHPLVRIIDSSITFT
jgi:uncharacterized protein YlxP (DUF503 family)